MGSSKVVGDGLFAFSLQRLYTYIYLTQVTPRFLGIKNAFSFLDHRVRTRDRYIYIGGDAVTPRYFQEIKDILNFLNTLGSREQKIWIYFMFFESLNSKPPRLSVCLYFYNLIFLYLCLFYTIYFIGIQIFNNGRRKFSNIPLDSTHKYATRSHNENAKQIIMNKRSEWISF